MKVSQALTIISLIVLVKTFDTLLRITNYRTPDQIEDHDFDNFKEITIHLSYIQSNYLVSLDTDDPKLKSCIEESISSYDVKYKIDKFEFFKFEFVVTFKCSFKVKKELKNKKEIFIVQSQRVTRRKNIKLNYKDLIDLVTIPTFKVTTTDLFEFDKKPIIFTNGIKLDKNIGKKNFEDWMVTVLENVSSKGLRNWTRWDEDQGKDIQEQSEYWSEQDATLIFNQEDEEILRGLNRYEGNYII